MFALETNNFTRKILQQFINHNDLGGKVTILSKEPEEVTEDDLQGYKVTIKNTYMYIKDKIITCKFRGQFL